MKIFQDAIKNLETVLEYHELPDHIDGVSARIFRNLRRIDYAIKRTRRHKFKIPKWQMNILRVGVYLATIDKDFQTEIAVNTAVELAKSRGGQKSAGFVNASLRRITANYKLISTPSPDNFRAYLAILHSHPDFLVNRWIHRFDKKTVQNILSLNNRYAPRYFRVNQYMTTLEELYEILNTQNVDYELHPKLDNFFKLLSPEIKTHDWDLLKGGMVVVQDPGFEAASICLAPKPTDRILEIGCAPGGKTSRLVEMTDGQAEIIAIDSNEERLYLAESNLRRMKMNDVKFIYADGRDYRDKDKFDKVLVDPPCTSFGVIRRHPEIKWLRQESDIERLSHLQKSIAVNAMENVRVGGLLVWSTCTTEPEENEEMVRYMLSFGDFEVVNAFYEPLRDIREKPFYRPSPIYGDYDGGFCATLRKIR